MDSYTPSEAALAAIQTSGLSKTTQANALALLRRAHPHNGHIKLSKASLMDLWGVSSDGTVRHYLTQLARAGIIHYSTNDFVYVDFRAWPPDEDFTRGRVNLRAEGGDPTRGRVKSDPDQNEDFTRGRVSLRAEGGDPTRGRVEKNAYKELNERMSESSLTLEEINHSIAILTDPEIRLSKAKATKTANAYPFQDIRAFCCNFVAEGRKPGTDAGLIAYWLEAAETVPPLIHNELWRRHMTKDEIAAEEVERAAAIAMEKEWAAQAAAWLEVATEPTADHRPQTADRPADDIWPQVLAELAATMPQATYDTWLRDTEELEYQDGRLTVGVPHAYAREWLQDRMGPQIERICNRIIRRSVEVVFSVRPRGTQEGIA